MKYADFLDRLDNVTSAGDGHSALCPCKEHDDTHNSLSVSEGEDGRILIHCHAGCKTQDVVRSMGLKMADLRGNGKKRKNTTEAKREETGERLTLETYAAAKSLSVAFLTKMGVTEWASGLRIPYFGLDKNEAAVRYRFALTGDDRFRWKSGSKPILYALWLLDQYIRSGRGWIVIVEGESDAQTLISHNFPALGLPGANNWKEDRDAEHLKSFEKIYVVLEPDKGGDAVKSWVSKSSIRDRVRFVTLGAFKDVNELHKACDPETNQFKVQFKQCLADSVPFAKLEEAERKADADAAWEACKDIATAPDILALFTAALRALGVVGEDRAARLLYLVLTSRLLSKPVSAVVKGQSSSGKSNLAENTTRFFPPGAFYALSSMSERALVYSNEPMSHRTLMLYEAAGLASDFASYLIRTLLSEGRIRYETVVKTSEGLEAKLIEREGPTNLVITTTDLNLHPENETRMLSIPVDDSPLQTARVLAAIANEDDREPPELAPWHALQVWLAAQGKEVTVPFATEIARLIPARAVRLRRDFRAVLSLIRTHALLHQATRERDEQGRIVATLNDYAAVYDVVAVLIEEGIEATLPASIRETVKAVRDLIEDDSKDYLTTSVSVVQVAERLGLDKSSAWRRVQAALDKEYIRNEEWRKGRPAKLVTGNPLPDEVAVLPSVETLKAAMGITEEQAA